MTSEVLLGALTGVLVAAIGIIPAVMTFRQAKATRQAQDSIDQHRLNQQDFELFRSSIREDYLRLRDDLDKERDARRAIVSWGKSVWAYVGLLQATMRAHNVTVPPTPPELDSFPWDSIDV